MTIKKDDSTTITLDSDFTTSSCTSSISTATLSDACSTTELYTDFGTHKFKEFESTTSLLNDRVSYLEAHTATKPDIEELYTILETKADLDTLKDLLSIPDTLIDLSNSLNKLTDQMLNLKDDIILKDHIPNSAYYGLLYFYKEFITIILENATIQELPYSYKLSFSKAIRVTKDFYEKLKRCLNLEKEAE